MSKLAKRIWNTVTTILLIAVILVAGVIAGPRLAGLQPYAVLSGSMEPTYHVGSLIYVKAVDPTEVSVGDPITYHAGDYIVTHRVVRVDTEGQCFYTKGDANETEDGGAVAYESLIGKPMATIPYLGYIANAVSSPRGMILAVTGVVVLLVLMFIPDILTKAEEKDKAKAQAAGNVKNADITEKKED